MIAGDARATYRRIARFYDFLDGSFERKRAGQQVRWMWAMVRDRLTAALGDHPAVKAEAPELEKAVAAGDTTPTLAAERLLRAFGLGD